MKLIKRIFRSGLPVAWIVIGALLFLMSSCKAPKEPTSDFVPEEYNYTSYEEKLLTGEINSQTEPIETFTQSEEKKPTHYKYTDEDIDMLARLVYAEAGGCAEDEQRLVIWTVFQRVDSTDYDFCDMNDIKSVVTAPNQFAYYSKSPVIDNIRAVCEVEISKWANFGSPPTIEPYAPTLPYLFFEGDGTHNWFRAEW